MQTLYCCNGQVRVLETGVIYGSSNPVDHKFVPGAKRIEKFAKKELRSEEKFVNLYSEVDWVGEAISERQSFFMASTGNYSLVLGSSSIFKVSSRIAPYFRTNEGKYERLWLTERFEPKMTPEYLNIHILASKLSKIIGAVLSFFYWLYSLFINLSIIKLKSGQNPLFNCYLEINRYFFFSW